MKTISRILISAAFLAASALSQEKAPAFPEQKDFISQNNPVYWQSAKDAGLTFRIVPEPTFVYRAKVVRVVDGDTVILDVDLGFSTWRHSEHIRLLNVDAPEITRPKNAQEKEEGLKAKGFLSTLLPAGAIVILSTIKDDRDKYGRYLGEVWVGGSFVNEEVTSFVNKMKAARK